MKRKKLLSTAVAGALIAAQMVMPVMAADSGKVEVDVTTTNVVIRVQVPTSLQVAVNQFEKDDAGSQIYSKDFTIKNQSEIPVKMTVTTTVDLAASDPINLVGTKAEAEASKEEKGEAWLAVAAMVEAPGTGTSGTFSKYVADAEEDDTKIETLNETSANVTTFADITEGDYAGKKAAEQTFYLAANATPTVTYKIPDTTDADKTKAANKISYAQIYELTAASSSISDDATLQAAVDGGNVVEDNSGTIKFIQKGTEDVTFTTGATYYTVASTTTTPGTLTQGTKYVYGEATAPASGGDAGFRFIGKLSDRDGWSDADITKFHINYDIKGVTDTKYGEVVGDCVYGLYGGTAATVQNPSITAGATVASGSGLDHDYTATFTKGTDLVYTVDFGNQGATAISSLMLGPSVAGLKTNTVIISSSRNVVTLKGDSWATANAGDLRYCKINFDDGSSLIIKITIQ